GDPILYESEDDMVSKYICNKALLEKELIEVAGKYSIPYTIARPAFIYGPFNYAPRESWYIEKIAHNKPIDVLTDGTAHFNFAYVVDVSTAMMKFIGNEKAYNQIFNISNPEVITEKRFVEKLDELHGTPIPKIEHTVQEVLANNIAIPWPLTDDELYDGSKFAETFGYEYTPFDEGMRKAYKSFMNVYGPRQ
ncbi:MAG: NAD-dependent epimerase/dehydratase family protein, partial [Coriobacteriales bacterium]